MHRLATLASGADLKQRIETKRIHIRLVSTQSYTQPVPALKEHSVLMHLVVMKSFTRESFSDFPR